MDKNRMIHLSKILFIRLLVCCTIAILSSRIAESAWPIDPSVNTSVCNTVGNQYAPILIKVADGFIVAWQDERRVYRDIYAQKFDVDGNMRWSDNGRLIAAGNTGEPSNHLLFNSQSISGLADDTQGGAIMLWTEDYSCQSGPCGNVWTTRVNSNGDVQWGMPPSPGVTIQGTDTAVLLSQHGHADAIAPDGEGGAFGIFDVDAWGDWYVFRIDANGAFRSVTSDVVGARGGARMIYGGNSNGNDYVSIAWWDYGDFAINIEDPEINYPASTDTLYAPWDKITLTSTPSWWSEPSLISDGAGGAIVVWEDDRNGNTDIFAQKISANGTVQWTPSGVPIAVQPGYQRNPQVVSDGAGGAVVVWADSRTSPTRVYAQHVGSDGTTTWTDNGIPISSFYGESPKIIRSDEGVYIIVWVDTDHNGGTKDYLRAQKIDTAGVLLWPLDSRTPSGGTTGVVISEIYSADFDIASDGSGGLITVWSLGGDIYAQRIAPSIDYSPASLSFTANYGDVNPLDQNLNISNTGSGPIYWSVEGDALWLSFQPTNGTNNGNVAVSVDISGLLPDSYNASITISWTDTTNGPITIPVQLSVNPPLKMILLSPNGGEVISSGSTFNISWAALAEAVKFKLLYSLDNGLTWFPIPKTADFLTGTSYDWTVPKPWGNQKKCLVKVIGYKANGVKVVGADKSNAPFTIEVVKLTSPNGEDTITCGVPNTITWTTNATKRDIAKVKLYYTKDSGMTWYLIDKLTDSAYLATGSHSYHQWVPTCNNPKINCCKIKVELIDTLGNILGKDASDSYFTIQP